MPRVLYLVQEYPQISQTYIHVEVERVKRRYDVSIAATKHADLAYERHLPYEILKDITPASLTDLVRRHRPDIIHGPYLHLTPVLRFLAHAARTYYTVRTHSYDVLTTHTLRRKEVIEAVNDPVCRGVLCFPFVVDTLIEAGVPADKLVPCWPVADIEKFRDRGPNSPGVMNVGATLPKKGMKIFADIAKAMPEIKFDLYAMGYLAPEVESYALSIGSPMHVMPALQPEDMPPEYKKHQWLVYTASKKVGTVGWPLAAAEAMASGVGVLIQNIRPDLKEYVGPAGYLFDSVEDVQRIITRPFPEEKREAGFIHAEKSNIDNHIGLLFDLWK